MSEGTTVQISAVICTFNRATYLSKAVESLVNQTYSKDYYEIIVVDNGSTDNTKEVVEQFSQSARIRYMYEPIKGLSQARNTGWQAAAGEYIAYLDDDAIACSCWLEKIVDTFENVKPTPASVGGRVVPIWESERPEWLEDKMLAVYAIVDWGDQPRFLKPLSPEHHVGCNVVYTRNVLRECGGFNTNLGRKGKNLLSNDEHLIRKYMDSHGLGIYYEPEILVEHLIPKERLTKRFMLRRQFWQGVSDVVEWHEESWSPPGRLWLIMLGLEGFVWTGLYLTSFLFRFFSRRTRVVLHELKPTETERNHFFLGLYSLRLWYSFGQSRGYLQIGMGHFSRDTEKGVTPAQGASGISRPPPKNWNRITWWSYPYVILKKRFFGIGGLALLIIVGLYIAGVLIEPVRWYMVGIASALILLCSALLALFYARSVLNRTVSNQRKQISDIRKELSDIEKALRTSEAKLNKELSVTKDDVFLIGYDILKEQERLADRVLEFEKQTDKRKGTDQSSTESAE